MRVIESDQATFKYNVFGGMSSALCDFAQRQYDNTAGYLLDHTREYFAKAHQKLNEFMDSDIVRKAQAAMRAISHVSDHNVIRELSSIGDFQQAGTVMQRWLMANPVVRERYHSGACEGYKGSYFDIAPDCIGEDHYDYRRVMQGIIKTTPEGHFEATTYLDELLEDSDDLHIVEQDALIFSWGILERGMKGKDDYTSPMNASL